MTRESYTGAHVNSLAPYAPDAKHNRRDSFQLAGRSSLRPVTRSHGLAARNDHASFTSLPAFERGKVAQSLIDIAAMAFWFLFIAVVGLSIVTAILILLFVVSFS